MSSRSSRGKAARLILKIRSDPEQHKRSRSSSLPKSKKRSIGDMEAADTSEIRPSTSRDAHRRSQKGNHNSTSPFSNEFGEEFHGILLTKNDNYEIITELKLQDRLLRSKEVLVVKLPKLVVPDHEFFQILHQVLQYEVLASVQKQK